MSADGGGGGGGGYGGIHQLGGGGQDVQGGLGSGGGRASVSGTAKKPKRRHPGRWSPSNGGSPAGESPSAKRAMIMNARRGGASSSSGAGSQSQGNRAAGDPLFDGTGSESESSCRFGGFGLSANAKQQQQQQQQQQQRDAQEGVPQRPSQQQQQQRQQRTFNGGGAGSPRKTLAATGPRTDKTISKKAATPAVAAAATRAAAIRDAKPSPRPSRSSSSTTVSTSLAKTAPIAPPAAATAAAAAAVPQPPAMAARPEGKENTLDGADTKKAGAGREPCNPGVVGGKPCSGVSAGTETAASAAVPAAPEATAATPTRWDQGTLLSLESAGGGGGGDGGGGEERGTPVPPGLRPPGRELDVLCEWSLDQLRMDDEVGMFSRGAFGKVVAARTRMDQQVAVKIVAKSGLSPERYIERELELLELCSVHPNVVGLHGVIRTPQRVYALMPLADTDLAAMVKSTVLDEKQAGFCVRQVVSAVEFLHSKGIVHRDVKPANILVLSNKVLLADFGLAKQLPKGDPGLLVGACGTKPYLAPELVRDVPYDAAVDMWAVGVVTYELLHGYTPFSPKLVVPRSWDGVVREEYVRKSNANNRSRLANGSSRRRRRESDGCGYSDHDATSSSSSSSSGGGGGSTGKGGSLSVSESSGSIVNKRMFERSAPPAPGGGLDRAWLAGQAHQALLFGKGGENDEYQAERQTGEGHGIAGGGGRGAGGGGGRRRRGHREQDQLKLLEAVVRGAYEVEEACVGEVGADFISQLLQVTPARRMSVAAAAEHPFLGPASKVPPRRRAARAEVAAVQTERAAAAAQRHKARLQQQQQQQEAAGGKPTKASAAAAAAAATALSDIAVLAGAMSDEARSLLADTKRWDKAAADAAAVTGADAGAGAGAGASGKNGGGGGGVLPAAPPPAGKAAEAAAVADAVGKAEAAVARAELLARESRAGSLAAEAVANSRELARAQEAAAATAAAKVDAKAGQASDATAAAAAAAVLKKGRNTVTGTEVCGGDKADGVVAGDKNGAAKTVFRFQ
ncbi:unnamed protein product [Ectocarpus sp. 4 AP-2014]